MPTETSKHLHNSSSIGVGCCPTQSQYPRRRPLRPDSLVWNTACSAVPNASMMHAEFGFPTQRLTENPGNDRYSRSDFREEFARQVAQGQAVYTPGLSSSEIDIILSFFTRIHLY
ncbi:unnamed protein product, partial [Mesorhabditis belari]|uniref:Uncharacterized protein n=1 Tax=Mesorhabditis belari TaxID=2138241 RepID=A0AAF3J604_9BILA